MPVTDLSPRTALVVLDVQQGILGLPLQPHPAARVVDNSARLAHAFRAAGLPVVLVNVAHGPDGGAALRPRADVPHNPPALHPEYSALAPELAPHPTDLLITKRQWGAFTGTELDIQLRRRGIEEIVLTGVATNLAVESTARCAYEHGYHVVVTEDATSTFSAEHQEFAITRILPMIARIDSTDAVLLALQSMQD
ncbi:isochorismatase family protein [Streptomyces cinnamoneus]|uniref:Isochorismatase n=1 Tax=Streptomyces cinnamoneus TaxID=53446 RepID=A0A918THX0_STRCJ|nr:isochorismatase family protein [Streptomyces cinnamoneus]GHC46938.1 isochorismatase [Streptomyces cinnamoneus]